MISRTAVCLAVSCLATAHVRADVTTAEWFSDTDYEFRVAFMPDLDQRRAGLPANGSLHCVPTSSMNLFAYAADWGFPQVDPGPGVWHGNLSHATMTGEIDDLGTLMGTDGDGTNVGGWQAGMAAWTAGLPVTYQAIFKTDEWCPTLSDAALMTSLGGLVNICYGRYAFNDAPEPILGARDGGHCVTMTYAAASSGMGHELHVADPNNNSSIFTEAPWVTSIFDVESRIVLQDWDDDSAYAPIEATVIGYDPEDDLLRMIDVLLVLFPSMGYSWTEVELNIDPVSDDLWTEPPSPSFDPLPGYTFQDVVAGPDPTTYYVLMSDGDSEWVAEANPRNGSMPLVIELFGATDIAVGRHGSIYALGGDQIVRVGPEGDLEALAVLPASGQALAYRDATDEVIVFSALSRELMILPADLSGPVPSYDVGTPATSEATIAVRESDGAVAVYIPFLPSTIYGVRLAGPEGPAETLTHTIPNLGATGCAFDDQEHLVIGTSANCVVELEPDGGSWWSFSTVTPSMYDGVCPDGVFRVTRSRTNYDPVINADDDLDTPAEELEYTGTVQCTGDFDNDQIVGTADLLLMLGAWGPCQGCIQNLNDDAFIDVSDLLLLLAQWGVCAE